MIHETHSCKFSLSQSNTLKRDDQPGGDVFLHISSVLRVESLLGSWQMEHSGTYRREYFPIISSKQQHAMVLQWVWSKYSTPVKLTHK